MKNLTNIFPITNLSELSSNYREIKIVGLKKDGQYQSNQQVLINRLSRQLRHPVTIIDRLDNPKLIIKDDDYILKMLPNEIPLVRTSIYLDLENSKIFPLDFSSNDSTIRNICKRFLQFDINGQLKKHPKLWQPNTGAPFFLHDHEEINGVAIHDGFSARIIELPISGFAIVIDATKKFMSSTALPLYITKEEFDKNYKGKHFVYKFGRDWYEIKVMEKDDLTVSQYKIDGVSLIDYVRLKIPKPHDHTLANLPNDATVLIYYKHDLNHQAAPSALCHEVLSNEEINDNFINRKSIMFPSVRFREIKKYRNTFFDNIRYGNTQVKISHNSLIYPKKIFSFPSMELGNNNIINPADFISGKNPIYVFAKNRMNKLIDKNIGFYTTTPLPNQFIVLPRSIYDSGGQTFIEMIKKIVNNMYPHDSYNPLTITYEDKFTNKIDYWELGRYIIDAITKQYNLTKPGFGLIMIPRLRRAKKKDHDKLGALLISEMNNLKLFTSIIHTDAVRDCLQLSYREDGRPFYKTKNDKIGKFEGYLRHVAINKILLNSNKWPFSLSEPLWADLTIGIDVIPQTHAAGFTFVDKYAQNIHTFIDITENKEKLSSKQIESILLKELKMLKDNSTSFSPNQIVVHRDGKLFEEELNGLLSALKTLKEKKIIPISASIHIIEIQKSSFASIRMFDSQISKTNHINISNPSIGSYLIINDDGYICTTGKEFNHEGTTLPLHVKFSFGAENKIEVINDLFKLSTLAFTKPDDCSRYPLTLKLNDIKLAESASEYDAYAYKQMERLFQTIQEEEI